MTKKKRCEYCNSYDNVEYRTEPYNSEIYNDYTLHWICERCIDDSLLEI